MAEENNFRPHLSIRKMEIENPRNKHGGPPKKPSRDNIQRGKDLEVLVRNLQSDYEKSVESNPPEFDPALIFRIKIDSGQVSEDELRRSGLTLLSEEIGNFVVLFSEDQLEEFRNRIGKYGEEKPEGQNSPQYGWIASLSTDDMQLWGRENRMGRKLAKISIEEDEEYILDVELWTYGSKDDIAERMNELKAYIEHSGGRFFDSYTNTSLSVARVKIMGGVLFQLLDVGIVETIDLPPQPELRIGSLINTPLDAFSNPIAAPSDDAQKICVIDSGIIAGHPLLAPAIGELIPVPASLGTGIDSNGHGTRVAGIALYGDVQDCIEHLDFTADFFIFGARVTNDNNRFDDEKLIVKQMDESIRYFHDNYECRIFNISLADPDLIYNGGKPSQWAQILDSLARELDVLIIVCTGNIPLAATSGDEAIRIQSNYPNYLLEPESRILEPATAANVLTVGALAKTASPRDTSRYPNDPSIRAIAAINEPSPFTRSGPGVNDAIKPEICEYGGNLTWNGRINSILNNDPEVGIVSTSKDFVQRLFTTDIGTSYATPKIANLAAKIFRQYPNISANLARALIANSSSVPSAVSELLGSDNDSILRLCGYGKPDLDRTLFSTDNRVTLISEDIIKVDTLHVYQIPIPEIFKETNGRRSISISLAFDPPVRHTRKGYLGLKMDFVLLRGLTTERIVEWYSARPNDSVKGGGAEKIEKIPNKYKCDMTPSITRRNTGTLQKATFAISRNKSLTDYEGDIFHIVVVCKSASWLSLDEIENQKYALTVTLEHLGEPIDIYNSVQQSVRQRPRVRVAN
jgi:subtilisin family serine protease